jgi:hypothetical protein
MKKSNYCSCGLLIVALGLTILLGTQTTGIGASSPISPPSTMASTESSNLVIRRAPNFGSLLVLEVSIDGQHVASLSPGQAYNGSLTAGEHLLSVMARPNNLHLGPTEKRITVENGQTYAFTAMWQGENLLLK